VVIRSVGERTVDILKESILQQNIANIDISIIQIYPFESALQEMMELGLASKKKWTIAFDGDTVIFDHAILSLANAINKLPNKTFTLQGRLFDKILGEYRAVGHRIYRTEYFQHALPLIPKAGEFLRPETEMIERMKIFGFGSVNLKHVYGLHGFEQYFKDIYRTSLTHGIKHTHRSLEILQNSLKHAKTDPDFSIVLRGFVDGILNPRGINLDASTYGEISSNILTQLGLQEKSKIRIDCIDKIFNSLEHQYRETLRGNPRFPSTRMGYVSRNIHDHGILDGILKSLLKWRKI
jgi:hypothetical protein